MHFDIGVVVASVVVMASPMLWVAWWLLADLAGKANSSYSAEHHVTVAQQRRRAA